MKFDRNTVIGFVLLALLFFGFFYFNSQEQARVLKNEAIKKAKQAKEDSIMEASQPKQEVDTSNHKQDASQLNAPQIATATGVFQKAMTGSEQLAYVENELVRVAFTNKGVTLPSI